MIRPGAIITFGAAVAVLNLYSVAVPDALSIGVVRSVVLLQAISMSALLLVPFADTRLLSPLMMLSAMGLLFYVVMTTLYSVTGPGPAMPDDIYRRLIGYSGSHAERIVLQFVSLCLFCASLLTFVPPTSTGECLDPVRRVRALRMCLSIAVGLSVVKFIDGNVSALSDLLSARLGEQIRAALVPATFFCLAAAILMALQSGRRMMVATLGAALACILLFVTSDLARLPLSFAAFAGVMVCALRRLRPVRLVVLCSLLLVVAALGAGASFTYRVIYMNGGSAPLARQFVTSLSQKLLVRQAASGRCLEQARARHWDDDSGSDYLYLVSGIVPRALWPEKPNLSRGSEYAVEYCGAKINPKRPHAEALTLLAEPIMVGGIEGLFVGEAIIIAFVGLATVLMLRTGMVGTITATAMLPWLTAFEHHLAYYIANCAKMFLIMLPFALTLGWYIRRSR